MSIPKNHHYVSQCHLKEFLNGDGKIFVYDKEINNFYVKNTLKTLFSDDYNNSKEIKGKVDHKQLEFELKVLIEDEFPALIKTIKQFLKDLNNTEEVYKSIVWLLTLGVIGQLRHPLFKENLDSSLAEMHTKILSTKIGLSKKEIEIFFKENKKTRFSNVLGYIKTACDILQRMEPFDLMIYVIESLDHFIIPDTSAFQVRGQLHEYPNPLINEIIQIGIPISDKIFILGSSKFLGYDLNGIITIQEDNSETVYKINKDLYNFSYKAVACSDLLFLKQFVEKVKS